MAEQAPPTCPRCGALHDPQQEYCLECGLRLRREVSALPALAEVWRTRFRRYPGDWIWIVPVLLLIAALATGAAVMAADGPSEGAVTTKVATAEVLPPEPPATTTTPAPEQPEEPQTTTVPARRGPAKLVGWPQGKDGYTIVLASLPATGGRAAATGQAREAAAAGLARVGVLESDEFASLHPGYYVVFTGVHDTNADAQEALSAAQAEYPRAYVRQVTP